MYKNECLCGASIGKVANITSYVRTISVSEDTINVLWWNKSDLNIKVTVFILSRKSLRSWQKCNSLMLI